MSPPRPELTGMRFRTMTRIAAILAACVFILIELARRLGVLYLDGRGGFMSVLLALAVVGAARLALDRDSWLPFLGECVVPPSVVTDMYTPNDATIELRVLADPQAARVVYWASESGAGVVASPGDAYSQFKNAGVVPINRLDGSAVLKLRCPAQYAVRGKTLPRHVHYRSVYDSGIMGAVKTEKLSCL